MINLFLLLKDYSYTRNTPPPVILCANKTVDLIIEKKLSVSRFGDGEFDMLLNIGQPKFQEGDSELQNKLYTAFNCKNENLLVCIPDVFATDSTKMLTGKASRHWKRFLIKNRKNLYKIFDFKRTYGDALFTRRYIDIRNKKSAAEYFENVKRLWEGRDIIIAEGRYTRFGVGNNLLDNAASVRRIICPAKNAFDKYEEIVKACKKQDKDVLFLLALGPTATVLAYDLCNAGYQAIDIGHLDIEYEWFLQHADKKCAVKNKWVNETDSIITEENDTLYDKNYEDSIIYNILNY